jgi:hypothetical protein
MPRSLRARVAPRKEEQPKPKNAAQSGSLPSSDMAERVARYSAANRHALAALRIGRVEEAEVVLEAAALGLHLTWTECNRRTAALRQMREG